jgi:uncharacterized membrane protein YwzB/uncharacterized membrane protein
MAFASAFGLSVFVTLVFAAFWGLWTIIQLLKREERNQAWHMVIPAIVAAAAITPFILDLIQNSDSPGAGGLPFMIWVREFFPLAAFVEKLPAWIRSLAFMAVLPINYLMELGFFLVAGLLWFQLFRRDAGKRGRFYEVELLLLIATFFLATFIRSQVIISNDFGWRSWLAGQFVLLIWSADLLGYLFSRKPPETIRTGKQTVSALRAKKILIFFIAIGVITTISDLVLLRIWPMMTDAGAAGFPNMLSRDNRLGERTLAAREMYQYLDANLPQNSIIQFNPRILLDRPSGLYRTRQAVISTHTLYGVSEEQANPLIKEMSALFESNTADWQTFDRICSEYRISAVVLSDYDPIWMGREHLKADREPLFENEFFAAFACGK